MSVTITAISNTDTFGTWKTKTNDLITVAAKAVTMGDPNAGNIALNGDITLETGHTITVDNIIKSSSASIISLKSDTKVEGDLTIDNGADVAKIQIARAASNKWTIETNSSHSELMIKESTNGSLIKFTSTAITSTGMTIAEAMLPATLTKRITHTGTGSSGSSFADCDIAAGNITGLSTLGTSGSPIVSSVLSSADINGGTIDNTPIGNSSRSTGKFSTVNATGTITANAFSGSLTGNVNGNVSGNAGGLTGTALTEVLKAVYPIGALYTSTSDISPAAGRTSGAASGLGFGSWERYAEGRVLVSKDEGLVVTAASASYATKQAVFTTGTISHGFSIGEKVSFLGMGGQNTLAGISSSLSFPTGGNLYLSNYGGVVIANGLTATSFRVQFTNNVSTGTYALDDNSIVVRSWCQQVNSTSASSQGGEAEHTLTVNEMPRHKHQLGIPRDSNGSNSNQYALNPSNNSDENTRFEHYSDLQGNDFPHNNLMPYKTVSIWRRTA